MRIDVVVQGQLPCFVEPVTRKSFRQSVKPAYQATCTSSTSKWFYHSIDGIRRFLRTLKIAFGYRALIIGRCHPGFKLSCLIKIASGRHPTSCSLPLNVPETRSHSKSATCALSQPQDTGSTETIPLTIVGFLGFPSNCGG
jgi:hypothetical protein